MKYFLDTEFLEGTQKTLFGHTKPTIDLISIGVVAEDGREYYAISKDFNLKEAWNRCDVKYAEINTLVGAGGHRDILTYIKETESVIEWKNHHPGYTFSTRKGEKYKEYWIRENVLLPIYLDKVHGDMRNQFPFSYNTMKGILKGFGKTNKQIALEIIKFTRANVCRPNVTKEQADKNRERFDAPRPDFYGYYSDYDWVVFCWLFGKMIDLPNGFPMYCIDLKQELSRKQSKVKDDAIEIDRRKDYPKQTNEHNALTDARWNFELYKFLQTI